MPELPEVETVRRVLREALNGHRIRKVEAVPDPLVFGNHPPEEIRTALEGRIVQEIGRKGKTWWIDMGSPPMLFGHLGMSGWVRELGRPSIRLKEHGEAPLDDESGRPRFLKLLIATECGRRVAFTDGRRLGRIWLGESPSKDRKVLSLGPDALDALPRGSRFEALFEKRNAPIKALLMDQAILSGIGNWVADEVLFHARIAPNRPASSLSKGEFRKLRRAIEGVLETAVEAGADERLYPSDWLFHFRWGGNRGRAKAGKHDLVRTQIGGRTTAWVPKLQK